MAKVKPVQKAKPPKPKKMSPEELKEQRLLAKTLLRESIGRLCSRDILLGYLLCSIDTLIGNCGTACVSFKGGSFKVTVDPLFFNTLGDIERTAVLEHEALHILHLHMLRIEKRDWPRWNIAADMSINPFIEGLPASAVYPPDALRGLAAEEIYDKIEVTEISLFDYFEQGDKNCPSEVTRGAVKKLFKDVAAAAGTTEEEVRKMVGDKIREADRQQQSRSGRGLDPGATMLDVVAEKTTFEIGLRVLMSTRSDEYRRTLKKPHRRLDDWPWGRRREEQTRIVVAVDNSGSISRQLLNRFFGEILKLQGISDDVQVIVCDSRVQHVFKLRSEADFRNISGGGGTDYAPAVEYANHHFYDYDLMMYLTDGECPLPGVYSSIPLTWVVTDVEDFPGAPMIWAPELSTG